MRRGWQREARDHNCDSHRVARLCVELLGSALIGGIFFAFTSFVMKALARVPSVEGIAAMQSINVMVLNPSFLGALMGTAAISLLVAVLVVKWWETPSAPWLVAGALLYLVGTFLLTSLGNVPLNNQLAAVQANDPAAIKGRGKNKLSKDHVNILVRFGRFD